MRFRIVVCVVGGAEASRFGWEAGCQPMADLFVPNPVRSDASWVHHVAETTSAAFSLGLPAAASGQLPFVITNIGPNLLITGMVSGEVNPTVPQWSCRTIASNGRILYFT